MGRLAVTAALALSGGLLWVVAATAWRRREAPAADLFAVVAALAGAGPVAVAASVALALPQGVPLAAAVTVALLLPVPWLLFAFEYTGRPRLVSADVAAVVAALPATGLVATAAIFGSRVVPWLSLPSREAAGGLVAAGVVLLGLLQWVALLSAGGLMLVGSGVLLWAFHRYEHLDPTTGTLLGVAGTVPWLSLLFGFQVSGVAPLALPWAVGVGFLVGAAAAGGAVGSGRLFRALPAAANVGPATVVEELDDLVVVTDRSGTVVDVNPATARTLETAAPAVVGGGVEALLGHPVAALRSRDAVELRTADGRRLFDPTVSELTDQHGQRLGFAVVLRDVTDRRTRRQRLSVLNRVLRHNIGNEATVVLGQAALLERGVEDPSLVDSVETIRRAGRDLDRLSEEAREVEAVMADAAPDGETVELASLADAARSAVPDGADASPELSVDLPADVTVDGSAELLELSLAHLVENAVLHADDGTPSVSVTAEFDPDRPYPLSLSVADDGPGIPEKERRAIERGVETDLAHVSGLGLWVVRWATTRLGGEVAFEDREPRGTVVTLRLPRARRVDDGTALASDDS